MPRGRRASAGISTGAVCQKALFHALTIAYSVSSDVTTDPTTSAHVSGVPWATPSSRRPTLPRKPDSGGMPARFIAGMKNRMASPGASLARPPRRSSDVDPPRRSTRPTTRNSVVCTVMWCTT
ncbi:Uncharacterised protein [Mycobacteroides abscessus]|nr:Uncharacterised protein [Mycobacteroides abscessus]